MTAGTFQKKHIFCSRKRLRYLTESLLNHAEEFEWKLEAWALFSNHYHLIAKSPAEGSQNLGNFLGAFHRRTATWVNRLDGEQGRKVWHNFRETKLSYEASYLARLKYVTLNPVKHGLVKMATEYDWCSATWFEKNASPAFQRTIASLNTDTLEIDDDF